MAKKSTTRKKVAKASKKKSVARSRAASSKKTARKKTAAVARKKAAKKTAKKRAKKVTRAARTKRPAPSTPKKATKIAVVDEPPVEPEFPKTKLSDDDLKEFTTLLLHKRAELVGDVNHLRSEALHEGEEGAQSSSVPIHMADISSDRWEQEFNLVLMESEQKLLREIDFALERISTRDYGVCEGTGKPITKRRLRAKPWARYCIEYARQKELGLVR